MQAVVNAQTDIIVKRNIVYLLRSKPTRPVPCLFPAQPRLWDHNRGRGTAWVTGASTDIDINFMA